MIWMICLLYLDEYNQEYVIRTIVFINYDVVSSNYDALFRWLVIFV